MNEASTPKKLNYKTVCLITIFTILFLAGVWMAYWLIFGQFRETTNDAYVNGNLIMIKSFEKGIVVSISTDNVERVEKGQLLVQLDKRDYEIALDKAKAELGEAVREVVKMFLNVEELYAKRQAYQAKVVRAELDYKHRSDLVSDGSVSIEDFEHSETDLATAVATLEETEKEWAEAVAMIQNTTPFNHPKVEKAKAELKKAFLALHRCKIIAPASGIIAQRKAQVGDWVEAYDPLMALVPLDEIWVDANFREVELKNIRIGQPVELIADMYGSKMVFRGRIAGLNPGTGSVFSILPPQNATGNWIKIIQRVPVKITLNPEELKEHPLVLGLSMTVKVDTSNRSGKKLPLSTSQKPIYKTDVYDEELEGVEELIQEIFSSNCNCEVNV